MAEDEPLIRSLTLSLLANAGFEPLWWILSSDAIVGPRDSIVMHCWLISILARPAGEGGAGLCPVRTMDGLGGVDQCPHLRLPGVDSRLIPAWAAYLYKRTLGNAALLSETRGSVA